VGDFHLPIPLSPHHLFSLYLLPESAFCDLHSVISQDQFIGDPLALCFVISDILPAVSYSHNLHGLGFLIDLINDTIVKLPAHRAALPGNVMSFILCPFTPPTRRGLQGTFRPPILIRQSFFEPVILRHPEGLGFATKVLIWGMIRWKIDVGRRLRSFSTDLSR